MAGRFYVLVLLSFFVLSCAPKAAEGEKDYTSCNADADCAIVDTGACYFPANKKFMAEVKATYSNVQCFYRQKEPKEQCVANHCTIIDLGR